MRSSLRLALFSFLGLILTAQISSNVAVADEAVNAADLLEERMGSDNTKPAEVQPAVKTETKSDLPEPKQDEASIEKRLKLAQEMHKLRPTRPQVDNAILRASLAVPEGEREPFIAAMKTVLNYKAIERISVDAMVEVYTLEELQAMVDYYSKPEAQSAAQKVRDWAMLVQPEINRMIDKAMMRVRTGAPN